MFIGWPELCVASSSVVPAVLRRERSAEYSLTFLPGMRPLDPSLNLLSICPIESSALAAKTHDINPAAPTHCETRWGGAGFFSPHRTAWAIIAFSRQQGRQSCFCVSVTAV